jgi:hypothetical protein
MPCPSLVLANGYSSHDWPAAAGLYVHHRRQIRGSHRRKEGGCATHGLNLTLHRLGFVTPHELRLRAAWHCALFVERVSVLGKPLPARRRSVSTLH